MSNHLPLHWKGDTAYCGKILLGSIVWNVSDAWVWSGSLHSVLRIALPFDICWTSLALAKAHIETTWRQIAADLTAQPEEPKIKAWWKDDGFDRFSLMAENPNGDEMIVLGTVFRAIDSIHVWRKTSVNNLETSLESAKSALIAATNAVVDSSNLDQIDTAGNGHDQTQGD